MHATTVRQSDCRVLLWLAEDLRLEDNLALRRAMTGYGGFTVLRIAPEGRGRPRRTPHRRALEEAAEARLEAHFSAKGIPFEVRGPGDDTSVAAACRRHGCSVVIRNAADGMAAELAHHRRWADELAAACIPLLTVNGEMIRRKGAGGARPDVPFLSDAVEVAPGALPDDHPIALLRAFLRVLPERDYLASMWMPGRDRLSTSLLSTHFAAGTLSSDRARAETEAAERAWHRANPGQARTVAGKSFGAFKGRVRYRPGFLTTFSRYEDDLRPLPITPEMRRRVEVWRDGCTGIPMPDAAMRELKATGWINFRLRQLAASYAVQLLGLPPFEVGTVLAELFDDYEPGITWLQVAINDGRVNQDRGPRILNPVKQGRDLDPDESYVRAWLPELASLPAGFAHEPWLHPASPLPPPLVDHLAAARAARAAWGAKSPALGARPVHETPSFDFGERNAPR
ncbi:FAD-binding domain-containing protein [Methylobacterium goesingense]|nr:FAD-binding domain-containing protein [Methylobacterium goesingense]